MTTEKKEHWTKSPEGQLKLAAAMKKMWAAKKAGNKVTTKKQKKDKPVKSVGVFTLIITGPDAQLVLTEILMGAYKVKIQVEK